MQRVAKRQHIKVHKNALSFFNFANLTRRYLSHGATYRMAAGSAMWRHLSPQNATIRHVAQKLQMNVFRSIFETYENVFSGQFKTINIIKIYVVLNWTLYFSPFLEK